MTFVNLTEHEINELISGMSIPPSGTIARITTNTTVHRTVDSIPIVTTACTSVAGIPAPTEDTIYIVSNLVADSLINYPEYATRKDIVSPGKVSRQNNQPIGCRMFRGLSRAYEA